MDIKTNISHIYRCSKTTSPSPLSFSFTKNLRVKKPKKPIISNHSFLNSREKSLNQSTTPIKHLENIKQKKLKISESKENSMGADYMKKHLDAILQKFPKIPKKPNKFQKDKKKLLDLSYDFCKAEEINRIYQNSSPTRSKSSFSTKKALWPKTKKESLEISDLQKYLFEFHQKSKILLSQLEQKVLGKPSD